MVRLFLTFIGECRLVFNPVGEALSRLVPRVHLFCVGTMLRDMLRSLWILQQTSCYHNGSLKSMLCQDLDVLAHQS